MSDNVCPRCGVTSPPGTAFCGSCGTPFAAAAPAAGAPPGGLTPGAYPPPPAGGYPPPPGGYPPPPLGYPAQPPGYPPRAYPPVPGAAKVTGKNTQIALGLAAVAIVANLLSAKTNALLLGLLAPLAEGVGVFMARKDMNDLASGVAPQLNGTLAKVAFWVNVVLLALWVMAFLYGMSKAA